MKPAALRDRRFGHARTKGIAIRSRTDLNGSDFWTCAGFEVRMATLLLPTT
jgi:hypothetical protein